MQGAEPIGWILAGDPSLLVLAVFAAMGTGLVAELIHHAKWREVAWQLGLELTGGLHEKEIFGMVDDFQVQIRASLRPGRYRIDVYGFEDIPVSLSLRTESAIQQSFDGADFQTGCPEFDRQIRVHGFPDEILAVLDEETRRGILAAVVASGAQLRRGHLSLTRGKIGQAPEAVRALVELGRRLRLRPGEAPRRLARNAAADPEPAVRWNNLKALLEFHPETPEAREASRAALGTDQPEIRLAGACFLGVEGLPVLRQLALSADAGTDIQAEALRHFSRNVLPEDLEPVLDSLAAAPAPALLPALVEAAGRIRNEPALVQLTSLVDRFDDETAVGFARAAVRLGETATEPGLLRLLDRDEEEVRTAAARALARIGTIQAVEPLLRLSRGRRAEALREAARVAVQEIQSRLGGAEAGQLSLAVPAEGEGALSLPVEERPGGELSLPPRKATQSGPGPSD